MGWINSARRASLTDENLEILTRVALHMRQLKNSQNGTPNISVASAIQDIKRMDLAIAEDNGWNEDDLDISDEEGGNEEIDSEKPDDLLSRLSEDFLYLDIRALMSALSGSEKINRTMSHEDELEHDVEMYGLMASHMSSNEKRRRIE